MIRLAIILTVVSYTLATNLHVVEEWKYIDYDWNCKEQKERAIAENRYNRKETFTLDFLKHRDGRCFVTTPAAFANPVPASLSTISKKRGPGGPLLKPYPNWHWYEAKHCKGITNVWRIAVDDCDRLWVVDSGEIAGKQACLAQLLVFNLKNDKLIRRITIPKDISHSSRNNTLTRLTFPVVETEGKNCERTIVYLVNYLGGGLVIIDGSKMRRVDDKVFHACPEQSTFNIAGENVTLPNGIAGLVPTPKTLPGCRRFYFRPLGSVKQYSVSVDELRESASKNKKICYTTTKGQLPGTATLQTFSRDGIMLLGLIEQLAIACWNVNAPLDDKHVVIVAQNNKTLQYASGLRITSDPKNSSKEQLWVMTNRLQKSWNRNLNIKEVNFRILTGSVESLVKGTKCHLRNIKKT